MKTIQKLFISAIGVLCFISCTQEPIEDHYVIPVVIEHVEINTTIEAEAHDTGDELDDDGDIDSGRRGNVTKKEVKADTISKEYRNDQYLYLGS